MKSIHLIVAFVGILFFQACQKEEALAPPQELLGTWTVESIQEEGQVQQEATDTYTLTLNENNTATLALDVNTCELSYTVNAEDNRINFGERVCTEACCESPFAQSLEELLGQISSYERTNERLILSGQGRIALLP